MPKSPDRSLKSANSSWHLLLVTSDVILLCLFVAPELIVSATMSKLAIYRLFSAPLIPIFVLLLVNVMSPNVKAMLVYWKPLGVLPGSCAFSKYGPSDPRVDMTALKKHVGVLPTDPSEQNSKWYKLYKLVESRTEVVGAQKDFLLYRDMAALSLPLIVLGPIGMWAAGVKLLGICATAGIFLLQYFITAISARNAGIRFVCNVLAIHSSTKVVTNKMARPEASMQNSS